MAASLRRIKCQQTLSRLTADSRREIHLTYSRLKATRTQGSTEITSPSNAPQNVKNDWIGPPDKVSNIRQMKYYIPAEETLAEQQYREQRQEVQEWHHAFWTKHNKAYFTLKEQFVKSKTAEKGIEGTEDKAKSLTPEEMSEFYKKFLDDNFKLHMQYNKEWYLKNLFLLWPALKVCVIRLLRSQRGRNT